MTKREISKLFEDRKIRTVWDDKEEKWYFSIVDVVAVLTDSADPKQYIKRMKSRDEGLKANWGTICTLVPLVSEDGKKHKEMTADTTGIFRIIQSIPSHKAEPIKQWIAHVAAERIDQMQDPELSIQQAMMDYKRLGYSDNWITNAKRALGYARIWPTNGSSTLYRRAYNMPPSPTSYTSIGQARQPRNTRISRV